MIHIEHLSKSFGEFQALRDLHLHVNKGEIYGFIGRNGAGKSTTMNIIAGLSKADQGSCMVNGLDVTSIQHPSDLKLGYLPENPNFQGWLTAEETLMFLADPKRSDAKARIEYLLSWVGLSEARRRRVGGFSRGMKQRLGLACALMHDPELIILDEPSSALDPEGRSDILALIKDLKKQGKTIILSTHILSDVERVCDRIGLIHEGKMILEKDLESLMNDHNKPILDIEFEGNFSEDDLGELKQMKGILGVESKDNRLSLHLEDKAWINTYVCGIAKFNVQLISVALRKNTLEDLFIKEVTNY